MAQVTAPIFDSAIATLRCDAPIGSLLFSKSAVWVKHFQAIHHLSVDVAHGLALLFGLGTKALVWGFLSQAR